MSKLRVDFETTTEIQATITTDGAAETGATVTISIDYEGTNLVNAASMTHAGSGVYEYTIASGTLPDKNELYDVTIIATASGNTSTKRFKLRTVDQ